MDGYKPPSDIFWDDLTDRQREVLRAFYAADGDTQKARQQLFLVTSTYKTHISRICDAFGFTGPSRKLALMKLVCLQLVREANPNVRTA